MFEPFEPQYICCGIKYTVVSNPFKNHSKTTES